MDPVIKDKLIVLCNDKKAEETTAGITKRITNGFAIPPVKKSSLLPSFVMATGIHPITLTISIAFHPQ